MVELFATRTHFDYHNPAAVADLQQWLADAGVTLRSVHAPTAESFVGGVWGGAVAVARVGPGLRARAGGGGGEEPYTRPRDSLCVRVAHRRHPPRPAPR